jgi:hypothetical protein
MLLSRALEGLWRRYDVHREGICYDTTLVQHSSKSVSLMVRDIKARATAAPMRLVTAREVGIAVATPSVRFSGRGLRSIAE